MCGKCYQREWWLANKNRLKEKRSKNRVIWEKANKLNLSHYNKKRYIIKKDQILAKKRSRQSTINEQNKVRYKEDIQYRLRVILRKRLWHALKKLQKMGSAVRDLGCSIDEFKLHIESKFHPGMSWHNMGRWHIDHIKPLSKFDLTNREQLLKACHYANLQPLWAEDNLKKGAFYE